MPLHLPDLDAVWLRSLHTGTTDSIPLHHTAQLPSACANIKCSELQQSNLINPDPTPQPSLTHACAPQAAACISSHPAVQFCLFIGRKELLQAQCNRYIGSCSTRRGASCSVHTLAAQLLFQHGLCTTVQVLCSPAHALLYHLGAA